MKELRVDDKRLGKIVVVSGILSGVIVIGTLFIPVSVATLQEFGVLNFGFPFAFVAQDFGAVLSPPPEYFPRLYRIGSPHSFATSISFTPFFASFCVVFLVMATVIAGILAIGQKK